MLAGCLLKDLMWWQVCSINRVLSLHNAVTHYRSPSPNWLARILGLRCRGSAATMKWFSSVNLSRLISFVSYIFPIRLRRSFRWLRGRIAAKAVLPLEPVHFRSGKGPGTRQDSRCIATYSDKSLANHAIAVIPTVCGSWDGSTAWYAALSGSDIYTPSMMSPFGSWLWFRTNMDK